METNDKLKILIIWDGDPVGDPVLINLARHLPAIPVFIRSYENWATFTDWAAIETVIILAELNWVGQPPSAFQGLDLVRYLRVEQHLGCPFIIFSFFSRQFFIRYEDPTFKGNILNAPGHYFFRLGDEGFDRLPETRAPIPNDLLEDIKYTFFNMEGVLHDYLHQLKNQLENEIPLISPELAYTNISNLFNRAFSVIANILPFDAATKLTLIKTELLENIQTDIQNKYQSGMGTYRGASVLLESQAQRIYILAPKPLEETSAIYEYKQESSWKVLFLDDEKAHRTKVKKQLESKGISCDTAATASEALNLIEQDNLQQYAVIISDIRLLYPDESWQPMQGYQFLSQLHHQEGPARAYFVLTSKKGSILNRFRESVPFTIRWLSKVDVITSDQAFNIFTETVREAGRKQFFYQRQQPQKGSWFLNTPSPKIKIEFSQYYKKHLESSDFESANQRINELAKAFIDDHYNVREGSEEKIYTFTKSFPFSEITEPALNQFRYQILVGRRIVIGLKLLGKDKEQIAEAMGFKEFGQSKAYEESLKQLFNTFLCISTISDFNALHLLHIDKLAAVNFLVEEIDFAIRFSKLTLTTEQVTAFTLDVSSLAPMVEHLNRTYMSEQIDVSRLKLVGLKDCQDLFEKIRKKPWRSRQTREFNSNLRPFLKRMHTPQIIALFNSILGVE